MPVSHHPVVSQGPGRTWVVECPECAREAAGAELPIGIGLPVATRETAQLLRDNHGGVHGRRVAS